MLSMFLYSISILFTPGPVTMLALNQGFKKQFSKSIGYSFGVGIATFLLFLIYGYTGERLIKPHYLIYISLLGGFYIVYLGIKIFKSHIEFSFCEEKKSTVTLKDGFMMQFFNPKASLVALPVATIHFPTNGITGISILVVSLSFLVLGTLSPTLYCYSGQYLTKFIKKQSMINKLNKVMALFLIYVGVSIFIEHALLPIVNNL